MQENKQINDQNKHNNCSHDCSTCSKQGGCEHKTPQKLSPNENSSIKKIYGVVSGKGGVGKSFVSSCLAVKLANTGNKVGILDADITGPSIPKLFGINDQLEATDNAIIPAKTKLGIKIISSNLLLDDPTSPVAWRGPVVSGAIQQFFNQVNWGELDVLLIDMPPGTSDVFLTIMQTIPIDGIISVSTPQDLVGMIVGKAINLANMMNIPVVSAVENMSYFECGNCGKKHEIFGNSQIKKISNKYNINNYDSMPIRPKYRELCDNGLIEEISADDLLEKTAKFVSGEANE